MIGSPSILEGTLFKWVGNQLLVGIPYLSHTHIPKRRPSAFTGANFRHHRRCVLHRAIRILCRSGLLEVRSFSRLHFEKESQRTKQKLELT